jgi:DNA adenine methylase
LRYLLDIAPTTFERYFEPFMGGGALFFALNPSCAYLSDNNADLINCYVQVRDNPDALINLLKELPNSDEEYYRIRDKVPESEIEAAARFVYLTTLSFNGIHRVNRNGNFNVPYGKKTHLNPAEPSRILNASRALQGTSLRSADFEWIRDYAVAGSLVYLDPPYTVAHSNNGFVKYNAKIFSWDDQVRLAKLAADLHQRGCFVIISNADHESVRSLYPDFQENLISRLSVISATNGGRKPVTESMFFSGRVVE